MDNQKVFPLNVMAESMDEDTKVILDGQKVLFDKKVSLLPVEIKKNERTKK